MEELLSFYKTTSLEPTIYDSQFILVKGKLFQRIHNYEYQPVYFHLPITQVFATSHHYYILAHGTVYYSIISHRLKFLYSLELSNVIKIEANKLLTAKGELYLLCAKTLLLTLVQVDFRITTFYALYNCTLLVGTEDQLLQIAEPLNSRVSYSCTHFMKLRKRVTHRSFLNCYFDDAGNQLFKLLLASMSFVQYTLTASRGRIARNLYLNEGMVYAFSARNDIWKLDCKYKVIWCSEYRSADCFLILSEGGELYQVDRRFSCYKRVLTAFRIESVTSNAYANSFLAISTTGDWYILSGKRTLELRMVLRY